MDINDNQQINTFLKGMNTDVSDALIDSSQYRYAENVRLVTNTDSNTGELRLVDGTTIKKDSFYQLVSSWRNTDDLEIIYLNSIRTCVVCIVRNNTQSNWCIFSSLNEAETWNLVFGPCNTIIWTDVAAISGVLRWETSNNIKLYFTDNTGQRPIMVTNLVDPTQQSVYTDIKYLTGYQNQQLPAAKVYVLDNTGGTLKAAKVQYLYRVYKQSGASSTISPLSNIVPLYKNNTSGYRQGQSSSHSCNIIINNSFTGVDKIQIYRINYIQNGQEPTVSLIYDDYIGQEQDINIIDDGSYIREISKDGLLSLNQLIIYPKLIESKENYLFAANLKYATDNFDEYLNSQNVKSKIHIYPYKSDTYDTLTIKNESSIEKQKPTLRRGETYHYGVIFYNKDGASSSVYPFPEDVVVPALEQSDIQFEQDNINSETICKIKRMGVQFHIDPIENCVGYEIVRCSRRTENKKVLFQGILGCAIEQTWNVDNSTDITKGEDVSGKTCPSGFITLKNTLLYSGNNEVKTTCCAIAKSTKKVLQFVCPEYLYQKDDVQNVLSAYESELEIRRVISYKSRYISDEGSQDTRYHVSTEYSPGGTLFTVRDGAQRWSNYTSIPQRIHSSSVENIITNHVVPADHVSLEYQWGHANIDQLQYPEVPKYNTFSKDGVIRFQDDTTLLDTTEFINWTAPMLLHESSDENSDMYEYFDKDNDVHPDQDDADFTKYAYPIGTGGECILIKTVGDEITPIESGGGVSPITIVNIVKNPIGYTNEQKNVYYSFGNYYNTSQQWVSEGVVFDGDAFFQVMNYNASHYWDDGKFNSRFKNTTIYSVPIETDIDLRAHTGYRFVDTNVPSRRYKIQDDVWDQQSTPSYEYNTAYSSEPYIMPYTYTKYNVTSDNNCDVRIHYSGLKENNQDIDEWLHFSAFDYMDVDTRFGEITQLKLFKDKLLYWQNNAFGVIGSNERTVLNDTDENQIVLGTGGVLQRYDYLSTLYGMKPNQFADTQSNSTLYWWDGYNKEILAYSGDKQVIPLGTIKSIRNYLNKNTENKKPHLSYDVKYKEVINSVVNNESVIYNEQIEQFTAVYKFMPLFSTIVNSNIYISNKTSLYTYNKNNGSSSSLFNIPALPKLQYVVNKNNTYVKTFDISLFGGRVYGGDEGLDNLTFTFNTPLKQHSTGSGRNLITNREYDFRLDIPRNNNDAFGGRMRGKTMQCELKSSSNSNDFSLQYIITKYRMSWS